MTTTDTTNNVTTAYEETHAARCLHIYLNNTADIYDRYTVPAINSAVANNRLYPASDVAEYLNGQIDVEGALQAAARLVRKQDHMTPTAADVEHVKRDYIAYIIECAQYKIAAG